MPGHFDDPEVNPRLAELVDAVSTGSSIAFVGAGSSMRVGYPSWSTLLTELEGLALEADASRAAALEAIRAADPLVRASEYRRLLGNATIAGHLATRFGPLDPSHDGFHEVLVKLPFRHILTSNYDQVLEAAHASVFEAGASSIDIDEWDKSSEFLTSLNDPAYGRRYLHVHGSVERPEAIVLSKDDYDRRYINETRAVDLLRCVLTIHRVVFIGFSCADADFMYILRALSAQLSLRNPRHFAILPLPQETDIDGQRATLRAQYVEPIYYDRADEHAELSTLINHLNDSVRTRGPSLARSLTVDSVGHLMEELLADHPTARAAALARVPAFLSGDHASSMALTEPQADEATEIDREIDRVFQYVKDGLPDVAIERYEAIRAEHADSLTPRLLYRLSANIGNALYSKGDEQGAADKYIKAVEYYRDSRDARGLEVLGHYLKGDRPTAHDLAVALCKEEVDYCRAHSLRVRSASSELPFDEIVASVPPECRRDAEVALAIADVAARRSDYASQEEYARLAVAALEDWPDALSALAAALLESERKASDIVVEQGLVPPNPTRVEEAEQLISQAIELIPAGDPANRLPGLYFNRAMARRLLGRHDAARLDSLRANELDAREPEVAMAVALEATTDEEISRAIAQLDLLKPDPDDLTRVRFVQAWLLDKRDQPGDVDRAVEILEGFVQRLDQVEPSSYRSDLVGLAIRVLLRAERVDDARGVVENIPSGSLHGALLNALRGRVEQHTGDTDTATAAARRAAELLDEGCSWLEQREVALLAQDLKLWPEAFAIWRQLIPPARWNEDVMSLLRCAYFAGEEKFILEFCATARENGVHERTLLELEVETLMRWREPKRAVQLLQAWVNRYPKDKDARLTLSLVAVQAGMPDLVERDGSRLPSVSDIEEPARGAGCVYILRRSSSPEDGVQFAYSLYRRFPDDATAQHALVMSVLDPTAPPVHLAEYAKVEPGAAVRVERDGGDPRWITVETGDSPSVARDEYAPSHALSLAMKGKSPGESFEYQDHTYAVRATKNGVLHRVHQIMERYEENFPHTASLRRFSLPENVPDDAPVEEKLGEIWDELARFDQQRRTAEELYKHYLLPLAMIAKSLGRSVIETVRHFAAVPTLSIRASSGTAEAWDAAQHRLDRGGAIVLDAVAVATIQILQLDKQLPEMGLELVVPESVVQELRNASLNAAGDKQRGYMGVVEGQFFIQEFDPKQVAAEVERIESMIEFIETRCEVVGGAALLELDADLRGELLEVAGTSCADAIAVAKQRELLLWTDDLAIAEVARSAELGVRAVWTQVVLASAVRKDRLSIEEYRHLISTLLVGRYSFTRLSWHDIAAIMEAADWQPESAVGVALAELLGGVGLSGPQNTMISVLGLILIWLKAPDESVGGRAVVGLLEQIDPPQARYRLARRVYRTIGLPIEPRTLARLKRMLRHWRSGDGPFKPSVR